MSAIASEVVFSVCRKRLENMHDKVRPDVPLHEFEDAFDKIAKVVEGGKEDARPVVWAAMLVGLGNAIKEAYGQNDW